MVLKGLGVGLVVAGIVHTGIGISELSAYSHQVALMGFFSLLMGALLYLVGAIEQAADERERRGRRE